MSEHLIFPTQNFHYTGVGTNFLYLSLFLHTRLSLNASCFMLYHAYPTAGTLTKDSHTPASVQGTMLPPVRGDRGIIA